MSFACTAPVAVTAECLPQYLTVASDTAPYITYTIQRSPTGAWSLRLREWLVQLEVQQSLAEVIFFKQYFSRVGNMLVV